MRVLCTGGAGYVGSACLRGLVARGHDAIAFDDLSAGNARAVPDGRLVVGDIGDRDALLRAMRAHGTEVVMHFAALASVPESIEQPETYYRTNVLGTMNVLDAMRDVGAMGIIASSTAATYAFDVDMPILESSPQRPVVPYGTTKLAAEIMIADYARAHGFGYAILRYFNASGADADGAHGEARTKESHLLPLAFGVALGKRDRLEVYGGDWDTRDGTCIRDYVHVADLASAHERCLEALTPGADMVYNLGSGTGASVLEVVRACERASGRTIPYDIVDRRPGDPAVLVASADKIRRELGWSPCYASVTDIAETAWRWHRDHPDGYGAP